MKIYLQEWLDLIGMTQTEFAKETGVSTNQISRIASGKNRRIPRSSTLDAFIKPLGLPERRFLFMPPPASMEEFRRNFQKISWEYDPEENDKDLAAWLDDPDATIYGKEATPEMKAHIKSLIEMVVKEK